MPSLFDCLQSAIDAQLAPAARARAAQAEFQEIVAQLETVYPTHVAQALAAKRLKDAAQRSATSRRHTVLAQLQAVQRLQALIDKADDPSFALIELIEGKEGHSTFESARFMRDAYKRQFMGMIHEALAEFGTDITGQVRNKAKLMEVVQELHGQASGSTGARQIADAVRKAQTRARVLFNAHGGDIGELADFGLTHTHEVHKVRAAGLDGWKARVAPELDWSRIEDAATGKPFAAAGQSPSPAAAERFLRDVYDGIKTGGWDDRTPSMGAARGEALFNRRADPRVLHFRNADAWMRYNDAFGTSNPFQSIITHFEGMARDIALMRVLGPNPAAGLDYAAQAAAKRLVNEFDARRAAAGTDAAKLVAVAEQQKRAEGALKSRQDRAKAMLGFITGTNNVPAGETMATFLAGTRQLLTGAQLGGAILSSATDLVTVKMAANAIGMNGRNVWKRQAELIASSATRETAAQMGYVFDTLANAGSANARFLGDVWAPEITSRITDAVLRSSGLSFWTDAARTAFQMEFSGFLASEAGKDFASIHKNLRRTLEGRGITAADWDAIRDPAAMFTAPGGAKFISPLHWGQATSLPRAQAESLSIRLQAIFEEQMELAIPSASLEGRAVFLGNQPPGTFLGELARSGLMYKSFALSVTLGQIRRANMLAKAGESRWTYGAKMIAGLTLLGSVGVQLKLLASGRDPADMTDPTFWGKAFFQGGGVGILGDFLTANSSRMGGGLATTLAGPVVGLINDAGRAVFSNAAAAINGRDTHFGRDFVNLGRRYTPGTSLWYTRLAMDRLVWDQLQWLLDPDAKSAWATQERNRARDTRTETFWERGSTLPDRGPAFSNITGAGQ